MQCFKAKVGSIFTIFILFFCQSQTILLPANETLKVDSFEVQNFGKGEYDISYEVVFSPNPDKLDKKYKISLLLQTNGNVSKFFDPNTIQRDSLMQVLEKKNRVGNTEVNQLVKIKVNTERVILKDFSKNLMTIENKYRKIYQYEEQIPQIPWKIEKETKLILTHLCQKATTHFRGRSYIAWFASDIILNDGPDLFQGLPGLILEIGDRDENFHFIATSIRKNNAEIYLLNYINKVKLSREKFRELQKNYFQNPGFNMGTAYNPDGTQIKIPAMPYNPLELE